jgi:signal transduction histidine kinase
VAGHQRPETFSVDTHLFRELGELLVGRDSTALSELVKNAYDADAPSVTVHGQTLDDPDSGVITVSDTGNGMTYDQFRNGFLRIASRTKEQGERRSPQFRRRYIGAKGIGRLAAHKLAHLLSMESIAVDIDSPTGRTAVLAEINWDEVEAQQTLDQVEQSGAITSVSGSAPPESQPGVRIVLSHLRRAWSPTERALFIAEMQNFEAPAFLVEPLPTHVIEAPIVLRSVQFRDASTNDPGFRVLLEGEFDVGEQYWKAIGDTTDWILEVDAKTQPGVVKYGIAPSKAWIRENHPTDSVVYVHDHPHPRSGPFFQARVLLREGRVRGPLPSSVAAAASGIRIFLEGFRVLPYGERGDDWLGIDEEYVRRSTAQLDLLQGLSLPIGEAANEAHSFLPNRQYYGAVFLTLENSRGLRMLVNREGFVPDVALDTVRNLMKLGLQLMTRVRAAASVERRADWQRRRRRSAPNEFRHVTTELRDTVQTATDLASEARQLVAAGRPEQAAAKVTEALSYVERGATLSEELISEAGMLRVLASVGAQMSAFIHEVNGLLSSELAIERALNNIIEGADLSYRQRQQLSAIRGSLVDLRHNLERQGSYLTDVFTPDARRRRSRQVFRDRFLSALNLVAVTATRRRISILNDIPEDLKSPPMFPAELIAVFSNLLTNAVKAAGEGGRIRAWGSATSDGIRIVVENTGVAVPLVGSEKWFEPFESTTTTVDAALGMGMGLGLTIVRAVLQDYGADIHFISPSPTYATALELRFPSGS